MSKISKSHKVGVLHRHVIALLDKAIVVVDIASRTDNSLCARSVINACSCFRSEALLARVENDSILKMLATRLVHGAWSLLFLDVPAFLVEAGAGYLEFQALSIEYLIVVEAWRCGIEADALAGNGLVVACTLLVLLPDVRLFNARDLVLNAEDCIFVVHMLALLTLRHNLTPLATLVAQEAYVGVTNSVALVETIGR